MCAGLGIQAMSHTATTPYSSPIAESESRCLVETAHNTVKVANTGSRGGETGLPENKAHRGKTDIMLLLAVVVSIVVFYLISLIGNQQPVYRLP